MRRRTVGTAAALACLLALPAMGTTGATAAGGGTRDGGPLRGSAPDSRTALMRECLADPVVRVVALRACLQGQLRLPVMRAQPAAPVDPPYVPEGCAVWVSQRCPTWTSTYGAPVNRGGYAETPQQTVTSHDGKRVFTVGLATSPGQTSAPVEYDLIASDIATGSVIWTQRYDVGSSVAEATYQIGGLIVRRDDSTLYLAVTRDVRDWTGGTAAVVAFDAATGKQRWTLTYHPPNTTVDARELQLDPSGGRLCLSSVVVAGSGPWSFRKFPPSSAFSTTVVCWNTASLRPMSLTHIPDTGLSRLTANDQILIAGATLTFRKDGRTIDQENTVLQAFDLRSGRREWVATLSGSGFPEKVTLSQDGDRVLLSTLKNVAALFTQGLYVHDVRTGRSLWARFGMDSGGTVDTPVLDPTDDDVYLVGEGYAPPATPVSESRWTAAIIALSGLNGEVRWVTYYDTPTDWRDSAVTGVAGRNGDLYIVGEAGEEVGGVAVGPLGASGGPAMEALVAALDTTTGSVLWVSRYGMSPVVRGSSSVSGPTLSETTLSPDGRYLVGVGTYVEHSGSNGSEQLALLGFDLNAPVPILPVHLAKRVTAHLQ